MKRRLPLVINALLVGLLVVPLSPLRLPPAEGYPGSNVQLEGAGWGHGRGMGQYGSLGYAIDDGWTYSQILDHFYGGTGGGSIGSQLMSVRLVGLDGVDTILGGNLAIDGVGSSPAFRVRRLGSNSFAVDTSSGCGGPWSQVATVGGGVRVYPTSGLVTVCNNGRQYFGDVRVFDDGGQRTVNFVMMEDYLRGVVPRESPASWGSLVGGAGMNALRAQAVAARSYAWSENRYSYAKTCDTTACQVYGGYSLNGTVIEDGRSNQAIGETAGQIRANGGGGAVRTEFSSSTGGYTVGGAFTAVPDDGDDVAVEGGTNPNHRWTASVAVSNIEAAYPEIGSLRTVEVTRRNGLGVWGGRVEELVLHGTNGSKTLSGNDFRSRFGLKSDWFRVVNSPSGGVQGYWVLDHIGGIFTFGNAAFHGSVPQLRQQGVRIGPAAVIDVEPTPSGNGYWVLDKAGGIFSFGDAQFFGSIPQLRQQGVPVGPADVIDLAVTASGNGYWLLDGVGGMFAFGDAQFLGSIPQLREQGVSIGRAKVVDMTTTPTGDGYVMIDEVGGAFVFGNGQFHGSLPALRQQGVSIGNANVVGVATLAGGYWMVDRRGGIFAFGSAPFHGSLPGAGISAEAAGIAPTRTGNGYLIVTADNGAVHPFGDAPDFGGVPDTGVRTFGRGVAPRYG